MSLYLPQTFDSPNTTSPSPPKNVHIYPRMNTKGSSVHSRMSHSPERPCPLVPSCTG